MIIGDVVVLKSNPDVKMTIDSFIDHTDQVCCVWFDSKNELQRNTFNENDLKEADRPTNENILLG